jgi:molybdopterin/thiamine biosynthesis adenylyltransferase
MALPGSIFDYNKAFARTVGWISTDEREVLRSTRIAIGGTGGTGGYYALVLARLGIGRFSLADMDTFEISNFNRQAGAFLTTFGRNKAEVMAEMIKDINPDADIRLFAEGIHKTNVNDFLKGSDHYINAMGLSSADVQADVFKHCRELNIPATSAIVPGFGAAFINFHPKRLSFEDYFSVSGYKREEQAIRLLAGHSPKLWLLRKYNVQDEAVKFKEYDGPVVPMSCLLAAGSVCTEVLKIILSRKNLRWAPWSFQVDAYLRRFITSWRPGGNNHLLQKLLLTYLRRRFHVER